MSLTIFLFYFTIAAAIGLIATGILFLAFKAHLSRRDILIGGLSFVAAFVSSYALTEYWGRSIAPDISDKVLYYYHGAVAIVITFLLITFLFFTTRIFPKSLRNLNPLQWAILILLIVGMVVCLTFIEAFQERIYYYEEESDDPYHEDTAGALGAPLLLILLLYFGVLIGLYLLMYRVRVEMTKKV